MKSKKTTYLLLAAAVGVWVTIIARVVGYNDPSPSYSLSNTIKKKESKAIKKEKSYTIKGNYRDPFFNTGYREKSTVASREQIVKPVDKGKTINSGKVDNTIKWPDIHYNGLIIGNEHEKKLAMISVDNKKYIKQQV